MALLAVSGCGAAKTVRIEGHLLSMTLDEYRILPRSVSVPAGRLRILAHNSGILTHNLTIELENLDSNGNPVILASTATIMPGTTKTIVTSLLSPGRFKLISTVANQAVLGMEGTLIVR